MDETTKPEEPDLDRLSMGGLSVVGLLLVTGVIITINTSVRSFRNTRAAHKILPQIPAVKITGVQVYSKDPQSTYLLVDGNNDNVPDFAVKPKESINFADIDGQPGSVLMKKVALRTFHTMGE